MCYSQAKWSEVLSMACGHRLRVVHKTEGAVLPNADPSSCRPVNNILRMVPTNIDVFFRGLLLCRKSRS